MPVPIDGVKHYALLSLLGRGGMGEVYLARDTKLDRQVAIKFLPDELAAQPGARERFLREAKAAAALDHPFICKIYKEGEENGRTFIVMEYVEGMSLRAKLAAGRPTLKQALQMTLEVAEALEAAHAKGFIHRDIKPANLMCTPQGHVKVMDFGLAKHVLPTQGLRPGPEGGSALPTETIDLDHSSLTREGAVVGTIAYMSPEQARGEHADHRSDLFAVGTVLAEMVTGKHPFARATAVETLTAILRDSPPPPHARPKVANAGLAKILHKALAKEPAGRYQGASDLAADLRALLTDIAPRHLFGFRTWKGLAAALAGTGALLALAIAFLIKRTSAPPPEPKPLSVLVADFANRTGDPLFEGVLEQMFVLGLEQAPYLDIRKAVDVRAKAAKLAPGSEGRVEMATARLICRSEGIPVAIGGAIETAGDGYAFAARAIDPSTGEEIGRALAGRIKKRTDIPKAVMSAGVQLSAKIGGMTEAAAREAAAETFTTSSLEAMKSYAVAQEMMKAGRQSEAIAAYETAITEDPQFGRAYAGLAVMLYNRGEHQKGRELHEKALAHLDRMTDREKFRTRSIWHLMTGDFPKAIEECEALVRQFPADSAGVSNLALAYFGARRMDKAIEFGLRRVALGERDINARHNLSWYYLGASRFEDSAREARKVVEANPQLAKAHVCLALAELAMGRAEAAAERYKALEPVGDIGVSLKAAGLADVAMLEGRAREAAELLRTGIARDRAMKKEAWAGRKMALLARALWSSGDRTGSLRAAAEAIETSRTKDVLLPAAEIFIWAGQTSKAGDLAAELANRIESDPRAYARIIEAEILLAEGKTQEAIPVFREAQGIVDTWLGRMGLGRAYLAAGAFAAAHSEFETCLRRRGEAASVFLDDWPSFARYPDVHYFLGRAQEGLKSPGARESYAEYLRLRQPADPGDPLTKDVKRRLAALGGF